MALGHVTSDHDPVSSHKLTRNGLSPMQRENLWGKRQGLQEEEEQARILKAMGDSTLHSPTPEQL